MKIINAYRRALIVCVSAGFVTNAWIRKDHPLEEYARDDDGDDEVTDT